MFNPSCEPASPLPKPRLQWALPGISILPPLSRRGTGPGLIVLCPGTPDPLAIIDGVPWPLVKWAEEGYAVAGIQPRPLADDASAALREALNALSNCAECTSTTKVGIVGTYC